VRRRENDERRVTYTRAFENGAEFVRRREFGAEPVAIHDDVVVPDDVRAFDDGRLAHALHLDLDYGDVPIVQVRCEPVSADDANRRERRSRLCGGMSGEQRAGCDESSHDFLVVNRLR
jgi:hypothetical protein